MNALTVTYQVIENSSLDCAEFSLCPKCSLHIIRLADGCSLCGWCEGDILQGGKVNCSSKSSSTLENKLSIPCLIKHPKQPEVKGIIQKDLGDRFTVYIPSNASTVNVSKLLVYPDFSEVGDELLQGGKAKCSSNYSSTLDNCSSKDAIALEVSNTSDKCSSKNDNPPSTKITKTRRHKGEGSGHIYYRTVTRNGRDYQQAYYQWRENGRQRTKYISKKLLKDIEEAEEQKLPVTKIVELLQGGLDKCSSNSSSTSTKVLAKSETVETIYKCSSKINSPPCTRKKRSSGYGGGYIEYREVKRNHKVYGQYWYHYEFWEKGDRITKSSQYIPKKMETKIIGMNNEKVSVEEILKVLRNKSKRKR